MFLRCSSGVPHMFSMWEQMSESVSLDTFLNFSCSLLVKCQSESMWEHRRGVCVCVCLCVCVCVCHAMCLLTRNMGVVSSPHAKNSRKITTTAWVTLARPRPGCGEETSRDINYSSALSCVTDLTSDLHCSSKCVHEMLFCSETNRDSVSKLFITFDRRITEPLMWGFTDFLWFTWINEFIWVPGLWEVHWGTKVQLRWTSSPRLPEDWFGFVQFRSDEPGWISWRWTDYCPLSSDSCSSADTSFCFMVLITLRWNSLPILTESLQIN